MYQQITGTGQKLGRGEEGRAGEGGGRIGGEGRERKKKRVEWMAPETGELANVSEPQSSIDGPHRSVWPHSQVARGGNKSTPLLWRACSPFIHRAAVTASLLHQSVAMVLLVLPPYPLPLLLNYCCSLEINGSLSGGRKRVGADGDGGG